MARTVALAVALGALGAAAVSACGPGGGREDVELQRLQTVLCDKAVECGCILASEAECGAALADRYGVHNIDPHDEDLAYDPDCQDRWLDWVGTMDCEAPVLPHYADLCPLYHGTIYEGMPCNTGDVVSTDCGRGLLCIAGSCRDPQRTAIGGPDQPCDIGELCDEGLVCRSSICRQLPGAGEPCLDGRCAAESRCVDQTCAGLPLAGERCLQDTWCHSSAYCGTDDEGRPRCIGLGAVGEPCSGHRQCLSGNCPAGRCSPPNQVGDACGSQIPCGEGLRCTAGTCQAFDEGDVPARSACDSLDVL